MASQNTMRVIPMSIAGGGLWFDRGKQRVQLDGVVSKTWTKGVLLMYTIEYDFW